MAIRRRHPPVKRSKRATFLSKTTKTIQWKEDPKVSGGPVLMPPRHYPDPALDGLHSGDFEKMLVPGTFFTCNVPLNTRQPDPTHAAYPFPVLDRAFPHTWAPQENFVVQAGSQLIYAGQIRAEESTKNGTVRVVKHTIIAGSGRYILSDLNVLLW